MSYKWDCRFLELAKHVAQWSKDPSTQVGAVIVDDLRRIVSVGYNGFPRGVVDSAERYEDRKQKYALVVHAEANAILSPQQSVRGCTLYATLHPCEECAKLVVQAGLTRVVIPTGTTEARRQQLIERGADDMLLNMELAQTILCEGGVEVDAV